MPQQRTIFRRIVQWVREQLSSGEEEEQQRVFEEHQQRQQRQAEELEIRRVQRVLAYNRWIERQRDISRRRAEGQGTPATAEEGPTIYRSQLPQIPEALERITRSLVLTIEENGGRFRLDVVQVYNENGWQVTLGGEIILGEQ